MSSWLKMQVQIKKKKPSSLKWTKLWPWHLPSDTSTSSPRPPPSLLRSACPCHKMSLWVGRLKTHFINWHFIYRLAIHWQFKLYCHYIINKFIYLAYYLYFIFSGWIQNCWHGIPEILPSSKDRRNWWLKN